MVTQMPIARSVQASMVNCNKAAWAAAAAAAAAAGSAGCAAEDMMGRKVVNVSEGEFRKRASVCVTETEED